MKNFLFILFLVLVGCRDNDVEDVNGRSNTATFDYDQVQVVSFLTQASDPQWPDLKDKAIVNLRTCLVDNQYLEPIIGEEFEVTSKTGDKVADSNTAGCINWTEEFDFKYTNDETFYEVKGSITGLDNFKGRKSYNLALNPWSMTGFDMNMSRFEAASDVTKAIEQMDNVKHLETTNFTVNVIEKNFAQNETSIKLEISTSPELLRKGLTGDTIKQPLTGGKFLVDYFIFSREMDTNIRSVIAETSKDVVVDEDGFLRSTVNFELLSGVSPNAQIELGVRVHAQNDEVALGSDEGIIAITSLNGSMSGELVNIPVPFSLLAGSGNQKNNGGAIDINPDNFGFIMDAVTIRRGSESGSNIASPSNSRVHALFEIRLVDPLIHQDIRNHSFQIEVYNSETNETVFSGNRSTQTGRGIINFDAIIPFHRYNRRGWKDFKVRITSHNSPYANITKERLVYINPWSTTSQFGIDSNIGDKPYSDTDNIPRISIKSFNWQQVGNIPESYTINKNLDMKFDKRIRVEFQPKIKMDHDSNGGNNMLGDSIFNGKYKLRMLILAPKDNRNYSATRVVDLEEFYVLTAGYSDDVKVEEGWVSADIELPLLFTDLMYYSTKNIALLELSSVDEDIELQPGYFVGHFVGYNSRGTVRNAEENSMSLSTGNIDIAKTLIDKIQVVQDKMASIESDIDYFVDFKERLTSIKPERSVFNHEQFKIEQKKTSTEIFDTGAQFRSRKNLRSSVRSIESMVLNPQNASQNLLNEICSILFDKNEKTTTYTTFVVAGPGASVPTEFNEVGMHYNACTENPFTYMDFTQLEHVKSITEQPNNAVVERLTLSRSEAYFISRGQNFMEQTGIRESEYFQHGWHLGAGLEGGKWGLFGAASYGADGGFRRDVYTMNADSEILSNQQRIINQDGLTMAYDRFDLEFKANVKTCLIVTGKDVIIERPIKHNGLLHYFLANDPEMMTIASPKRLYICTRGLREVARQESWYFVKADKGSTIADSTLDRNSMISIVRGVKNFENFRKLQIESDKALIIHESDDNDVVTRYQNYIRNRGANISYKDRVGVGFPGLIE